MKKRNKFVNVLLLLLVLTIVSILYFEYQTDNKKISETNQFNNSNTTLENIIKNPTSENQITFNNITPLEETNNSSKTATYEFTSADNFAAQGNPGILKIFELTNTKIEFEYNHGWNFAESTIDRKISGVAEKNIENIYEFTEHIDSCKYTIKIEFTQEMAVLSEYIDDELISRINLWS